MPSLGYPHPFKPSPWTEIAEYLGIIAAAHPHFLHMVAIANSVVESKSTHLIAGCTSMHDIIVVPVPIPEPPYEVIRVRSPSSPHPPKDGEVLIEHLSHTGNNDAIARPTSEAVTLFWRFIIEKFGVHAVEPPDTK